ANNSAERHGGCENKERERSTAVTVLEIIILLMVAAICGALGQAIGGYSRGGCLVSIVLGFIGAMIGVWLARMTSLPEMFTLQIGEVRFPIIWSIIGAALFVLVIGLLRRPTDYLEPEKELTAEKPVAND